LARMSKRRRGGQSRADFISKYSIACKEARETHYWLRLLVGAAIVTEGKLESLIQESDDLIAILTTIIKNTKANLRSEKEEVGREKSK